MKLAIFGASGHTGVHLVEQALAVWPDMVALMRNPAKLALRHDRLRVAQGELTNEVVVADAARGADAVLASLSPKILGGPREVPLASGTGTILAAMRAHRALRLVYNWGPSIVIPRNPLLRALRSASFALFGLLPATRSMVNETVQVGEAVRGSDSDWAIVVVTAPNDQPGSGRVKVRTRTGSGDRVGSRIARADLAQFILAQTEDLRYARQELRISD
ncbi:MULTISPECIES: NAD(P)-dependent oxidoreductase [unclassified Micromonospora]|uniref:NAD(P)-dependent oxidoreductase n=1 Tax=unclassified Micromonospora TaxID=2617518 RepID=UPI001C5D96BD|nr:NAD(P)H-binding protein [Micromonospora sp. RL09-050-HVF-A]MBW4702051.1 NAD(P)H-binding protein [Micromonospora sp. RL09-050-HVF-A]